MASEFLHQLLMLPYQLGVPMAPAPCIHPLQGPAEPGCRRLSLEDPGTPPSVPPLHNGAFATPLCRASLLCLDNVTMAYTGRVIMISMTNKLKSSC
jgi:hypothetical protein